MPKPKCEECNDTKELIEDYADYRGEHVQNVYPCICTLKNKKPDNENE